MKVRLVHCIIPDVGSHGDVVEMTEEQARYYIELEKAVALEEFSEPEPVEPAQKVVEPQAKKKRGRGRVKR